MDRLHSAFARCRDAGESALVTYVMGGDPDPATSLAMALACVEGGADVLELGVPFSDPIADGPTIQAAAQRALSRGTTLEDVLDVAARVRARSQIPIALMGYLNPMIAGGVDRLVAGCTRAGVDALIIPDLLPEEAGLLAPAAGAAGLKLVYLLAPTSNPARVEAAARAATGFLYFVSVTGVTGARRELPPEIGPLVASIRRATALPVVIGFGVSTAEQARALGPAGGRGGGGQRHRPEDRRGRGARRPRRASREVRAVAEAGPAARAAPLRRDQASPAAGCIM